MHSLPLLEPHGSRRSRDHVANASDIDWGNNSQQPRIDAAQQRVKPADLSLILKIYQWNEMEGIHKMRPRFLCNSLPAGLMLGVFVFLLRPVSTQKIRNQIYFLDNEGDIVLNGPDNPGSDTVVWEWEPHSGRGKQTVVTLRVQYNGTWSKQWGNGWGNTDKNQEVDVDGHTGNLAITKPTFKWSGLFTLTETHPRNQILKQYEIYGMKGEWVRHGSTICFSVNNVTCNDEIWREL
ncbi:uncharacterized protein LOC116969854 [Amblyraja radiata]|uniref:uncharacterized protein LOC116969854 n=1 Tax=Amblyraja radiata TaxID=386614 RepID=UPI0014020697|nr:uncharacterized protein LOC116969854 [Amblyraja radiata]